MTDFDGLYDDIRNGMEGKNSIIPIGLPSLERHMGIRQRILTLLFSSTGAGKSSFVNNTWILNPYDWYISENNTTDIKMKVVLFAQERSKKYTIAKWLCRKIFLDYGVLIPLPKLMGWWSVKLTKDEHDLVILYKDYIDNMLETVVDIYEGATNPTGVYRVLKEYAEKNGKVEQISEYKKVYIPNNPKEIVIPIIDHINITKVERGMNKKESIDKLVEYLQIARDLYGYSPVAVAQMNRDISNPLSIKQGDAEPNLDQIKQTGDIGDACDIAISIFDPIKFKQEDAGGYNARKFIDQRTGAKHFRSLKIVKSSYGEDDIRKGLAFHGAIGYFKELNKSPDEMSDSDYNNIIQGNFYR